MQNNQTIINFLFGVLLFMLGGILWFVRYIITSNVKEHDGLGARLSAVEEATDDARELIARLGIQAQTCKRNKYILRKRNTN